MTEKSYMERLADSVFRVSMSSVPVNAVNKAKLCIMDALECCLSYMTDNRAAAALMSVPKRDSGCTMITSGLRAAPADAAFFNAVKGSVPNRNDLQIESAVHAGAVIFPAVLAVAEDRHLSGRAFLECILAGYEATTRFGSFLKGRIGREWRTTAVFSPVGCALAAAKAMGLDSGRIASAGSIAANSASGFNQWAARGTGEDVFQNGNGARNGINAALLAENGAAGCPDIIEGSAGLASAFGITDGFGILSSEFQDDWTILNVIHKPLECCIIVQAPCQCAESLIRKYPDISLSDIESIRITMPDRFIKHPGCSNKDIKSQGDAIMSICFGVAAAMSAESADSIVWTPPFDEKVLALAGRCTLVPSSNPSYSFYSPVRIEAVMSDGRLYSYEQGLVPLTDDGVKERFRRTAERRLGKDKAMKLYSMIMDLENSGDICSLTDLLF